VPRHGVPGPGPSTGSGDQPLVWYEGAGLTTKRFFHADAQGSIIATTDATGTTSQTLSYGPYGDASSNVGSRFKYTGQITLPGVGLLYYKARMYSPLLGRFLQTDPIGTDGGMNVYGYVGGDPVNASDPWGLASQVFSPRDFQAIKDGRGPGLLDDIIVTAKRNIDAVKDYFDLLRKDEDMDRLIAMQQRETNDTVVVTAKRKSKPDRCNQALVDAGNLFEKFADASGDLSSNLILGGGATAIFGIFTLQPVLVARGGALVDTGGIIGLVAGGSQFTGGILQGLGGAGYSNSAYAAVTAAGGAVLGRIAGGPRVRGYRTRSQRKLDKSNSNAATVAGSFYDVVTNFLGAAAPQQLACPSN
jgi:RHS repeat-associated protein